MSLLLYFVFFGREKDGRKCLVYDLMEFFIFGNSSEMGFGFISENLSCLILLWILLLLYVSFSLNNLLFVLVVNSGEESRRVFIYDFMEFLFLLCFGGNLCFDLGFSSLVFYEEGFSVVESKMSDLGIEKVKEKWSLFMYDLEEFLFMIFDILLFVWVIFWEEE